MKTIACWINREGDRAETVRAWVIGDSRLTTINHNREPKTLVDGAIKVFSLPIVCKKPNPNGNQDLGGFSLGIGMTVFGRNNLTEDSASGVFFNTIYFTHSIGMTYAGSSLLGTNLFLTLMTITSNMSCIDEYIPSICEIAIIAKDLAVKMCEEYSNNIIGPVGFEFCLIGFCKNINDFQLIYVSLKKTSSGEIDVVFENLSSKSDDFFLLLGDRKDEIAEQIHSLREKCANKDINWWRAPSEAIRCLVERQENGTIGGYLQAGLGHCEGFNLIGWDRYTTVTFLTSQVGISIGKCFFNIPGLR